MANFDTVKEFEQKIAKFFGSTYAVATDSCTHSIELSLRHDAVLSTFCPKNTYLSIPMTLEKLGIEWSWVDHKWSDYYFLKDTRIIDAAVLWRKDSYIPGSLMCLSFQFRKHLSVGRGGMILTDNLNEYNILKSMSYDGRDNSMPWSKQDIFHIGYHYYMTPETAEQGIFQFHKVKNVEPNKWTYNDYPNLSRLAVFNNGS